MNDASEVKNAIEFREQQLLRALKVANANSNLFTIALVDMFAADESSNDESYLYLRNLLSNINVCIRVVNMCIQDNMRDGAYLQHSGEAST